MKSPSQAIEDSGSLSTDSSTAPSSSSVDAGPFPPPPPDPCGDDLVTVLSLNAAFTALDGGATKVALSPKGCLSYERTLNGSELASELFTEAGKVIGEFTYSASGAEGRQDLDGDGFVEWESTLTGTDAAGDAGSGNNQDLELKQLDPSTSAVVWREHRTLMNGMVHIVLEDHGDVVDEYDTDLEQMSNGPPLPPGVPCANQDDTKRYKGYVATCLNRTPKCLANHGRADLEKMMLQLGTKVNILCANDANNSAYASNPGTWSKGPIAREVTIKINQPVFDGANNSDLRIATLCHEIMHSTTLGAHDPLLDDQTAAQGDGTIACEQLCGYTGNSPNSPASNYFLGVRPTKCQCATCTGQKSCSATCAGYRDCNANLGAICPCPKNHRLYPKLSDCEANCPSGLSCFGYKKCYSLDSSCP
jgi:hypothetical protein